MRTIDLVRKYRHIFNTDYTQDTNCQGAWRFEEGSGITVADDSPNTNTGDFKATGEPAWTSGNPPKSYVDYYVNFDATDDFINCGSNASLDIADDITICAWINPDVVTAGDEDTILAMNDGDDANLNYKVSRLGDEIRFAYATGGSAYDVFDTSNSNMSADTWYHIAVTYDRNISPYCKVYLNGSLRTGSWTVGAGGDLLPIDTAAVLLIGDGYTTNDDQIWDGFITEVAVFNRILSSTEINEIMDYGLRPAAGGIMTGRKWWGDL